MQIQNLPGYNPGATVTRYGVAEPFARQNWLLPSGFEKSDSADVSKENDDRELTFAEDLDEKRLQRDNAEPIFPEILTPLENTSRLFDSADVPDFDLSSGSNGSTGLTSPRDFSVLKPKFEMTLLEPATPATEKETFHWKPALRQSLAFLLEEHAFRMADDPYARHLVWHKPFWNDYFQSANHFVMSRWGDGDDFIVNYIGHPMQGSVSGLIEIQNDPHGRSAKFGKSSIYWHSRLRAMLWAGVYSAYFEIGPILSETALGSEGGFTYVPRCGLYPCSRPGRTFKSPTNNTGWVDFTVTPLIGTGWTILEDAIERQIVDRLAKGDPRFRYEVLRGALSPSHAMANMLSGKFPWYRITLNDEMAMNSGVKRSQRQMLREQAEYEHLDEARDEWEIGIGYTSVNLPRDWNGCTACRINNSGLALTFDRRLSRWFAFDAETDLLPGDGGTTGKGGAEEGLFGTRIGHPNRTWGVFTTVRLGFIRYDEALAVGTTDHYESITRFAADVGEFFEYYPSRNSTVRFGVADTMVRYLTGKPDPGQPQVSVLSTDYIMTHSNLQLRSEYVIRF
jgi:hypothetical protein